jgi:co-chaperonin GroES (HSP10)
MSAPIITDLRPDRTKQYSAPKPILDRILVRRINKADEDGFAIPDKFREKSRLGEVLAVGDCVVLGGQKYPLTDFVNVGDRVIFGEYTAEAYDHTDPSVATQFIVRVQDCRTIERLVRE